MVKKWLLPFVAAFIIMFHFTSLSTIASEGESEAEYLDAIGLLRGDGNGYNLEDTVTRIQGAVMVVRLIGKEKEALSEHLSHPFDDVPAWGSPYVGYLYTKGLSNGKAFNMFGSDDLLTEEQYVTFLLRILGYSDAEGEFLWHESLEKANDIGMIDSSEPVGAFLRSHMVSYTLDCLNTPLKSSKMSLLERLEEMGRLTVVADTAAMIYSYESEAYDYSPETVGELQWNLEKMLYHLDETSTFDVNYLSYFDIQEVMAAARENASGIPGHGSVMSYYNISRSGNHLKVSFEYKTTPDELLRAKDQVDQVMRSIITDEMTVIDKEIAIHDYIVHAVTYDDSAAVPESSYTIAGAVNNGLAVCQGYAELFQLMAYESGIDAQIVFGEALIDGRKIPHAWNMVTIDGASYHIDATWNDPVIGGMNGISYSYFNLTDEEMMKDHQWDQNAYPRCNATEYNYYVYNRQVVYSDLQLRDYIQDALNRDEGTISVKVIGVQLTTEKVENILSECYGYDMVRYRLEDESNVLTLEAV